VRHAQATERLRLTAPTTPSEEREPEPPRSLRRPLIAFALTLAGSIAFAGGAVSGPWALWAAGLVAVCASLLIYK